MVNLLNGAFNQTQARAIEKFVAEALANKQKEAVAPVEVAVKAEVVAPKAPKAVKELEKAAE